MLAQEGLVKLFVAVATGAPCLLGALWTPSSGFVARRAYIVLRTILWIGGIGLTNLAEFKSRWGVLAELARGEAVLLGALLAD